ncbi:hypothetical protein RMSM_06592 [Rhodopirellula maiorica SM1]|uniref:Uncharacterized protein n=1 Tax=Rhodopirellula maiorica SM1 TaxID=1265738 RepID=M5RAH0_9BACT|nr:hypothetical protein RMSM_06592 [Rhodopirellula maiorica SM1]
MFSGSPKGHWSLTAVGSAFFGSVQQSLPECCLMAAATHFVHNQGAVSTRSRWRSVLDSLSLVPQQTGNLNDQRHGSVGRDV